MSIAIASILQREAQAERIPTMSGAEHGHIDQDRPRKVRGQDVAQHVAHRMRAGSGMAAYILHLQRTIGNQAVGRWLRQRQAQRDASTSGPAPGTAMPRSVGSGTTVQRQIKLVTLSGEMDPANKEQVLRWLRSSDSQLGTSYSQQLDDGMLRALEALIQSPIDHKTYGFLQAAELLQDLRERTELQQPGRIPLLEDVHQKHFSGHKPDQVLYLGAGADIENPLKATGGSEFTLVDTAPFNIELLEEKIRKMHRMPVSIEREQAAQKVTALVVKHQQSGEQVMKVNLKKKGYSKYLEDDDKGKQFDVLFDKDSWLGTVENKGVVEKYVARLKTGGKWVSNYALGGDWFREAFDAIGLVDMTDTLDETKKHYNFGNAKIRIYQKTEAFRQDLFQHMQNFCDSTVTIVNTIEERRITRETYEASESGLDSAFESFCSNVNSIPGNNKIVTILYGKLEELKEKLEERVVEEKKEEEVKKEIVVHGFQISSGLFKEIDGETFDPQTRLIPDDTVLTHTATGRKYKVTNRDIPTSTPEMPRTEKQQAYQTKYTFTLVE